MASTNRIEYLHARKKHCCCKYCGGKLEVHHMIFGNKDEEKVELYCPSCEKMEYGVDCHIYAVAEYYVEEMGFSVYEDIEQEDLKKQMNIAKIAEIISWGFSQLGYEGDEGLLYPVTVADSFLHEHLDITLAELAAMEKQKEGLS